MVSLPGPNFNFRNRPVSWPFGLDTVPSFFYPKNDPANPNHLDSLPIEPALVVPWYPEKSVLIFRERSRDTAPGNYDPYRNQMPPLGTYEVNANLDVTGGKAGAADAGPPKGLYIIRARDAFDPPSLL